MTVRTADRKQMTLRDCGFWTCVSMVEKIGGMLSREIQFIVYNEIDNSVIGIRCYRGRC